MRNGLQETSVGVRLGRMINKTKQISRKKKKNLFFCNDKENDEYGRWIACDCRDG